MLRTPAVALRERKPKSRVGLNQYHAALYLPPVEEEAPTKARVLLPVSPKWSCHRMLTVREGFSVMFHNCKVAVESPSE
jgi:hypothetical protein